MAQSATMSILGQYEDRDIHHPKNETYEGIENFNGLAEERVKTNIWGIPLFISVNCVVIALIIVAIFRADPARMLNGQDFRGDMCGRLTLINRPYMYWPDPINLGDIGICVDQCPSQADQDICFYDTDGKTILDDYCYSTYVSYSVGMYCIPVPENYRNQVFEFTTNIFTSMKKAANDLIIAREAIAIGIGACFIFGLIWLIFGLIPYTSKYFIWISVGIGSILTGLLGWSLWNDYRNYMTKICPDRVIEQASSCGGFRAFFLEGMTFVCAGCSFIYLVIMIFKWRNINFAIMCFPFTLKPIRHLSAILLAPIISFLIAAFVFYGFIYVFIAAMSSGTIQTLTAPKAFPTKIYRNWVQPDWNFYIIILYSAMYFWWMHSILNFNRASLGGLISGWYFTKEKTIMSAHVGRCLKTITKHHLGTIFIGPVIMCMWPLKKLIGFVKQRLTKSDKTSKYFKHKLNFWRCALYCYEHLIKYITNVIYFQIALFGDDYWEAGIRVYYLEWRNDSRLKEFKENLGGWVPFIGKFMIALSGAVTVYQILLIKSDFGGQPYSQLEYTIIPPFVTFFGGWYLGEIFGRCFNLATDAMIFSFICDEEMYLGRQRFCEPEFRAFMDGHGREAERNLADYKVRALGKKGDDTEAGSGLVGSGKPVLNFLGAATGEDTYQIKRMADNDFVPMIEVIPEEPQEPQEPAEASFRLQNINIDEEDHNHLSPVTDDRLVGDKDANNDNLQGVEINENDNLNNEQDIQAEDYDMNARFDKNKNLDEENSEDEEDIDKNKKSIFQTKPATFDF